MSFLLWLCDVCSRSALLNYVWFVPVVSFWFFYNNRAAFKERVFMDWKTAGLAAAVVAVSWAGAFFMLKHLPYGSQFLAPLAALTCGAACITSGSRKKALLVPLGLLFFMYPWEYVLSVFVTPVYQAGVTGLLAAFSLLAGLDVSIAGPGVIETFRFALSITPACTGLGVHLVLAFVVIAISFMADKSVPCKKVLKRLLVWEVSFLCLNILRIAALFMAGHWYGDFHAANIFSAYVFFGGAGLIVLCGYLYSRYAEMSAGYVIPLAVRLCVLVVLSLSFMLVDRPVEAFGRRGGRSTPQTQPPAPPQPPQPQAQGSGDFFIS